MSEATNGEEDEEVKFTLRSRVYKYQKLSEAPSVVGIGTLKVLTHKDSGKSRVLVRSDGMGKVLLNAFLNKSISYAVTDKSVKIPVPEAGGIVMYLAQVKTADMAKELAEAMNAASN